MANLRDIKRRIGSVTNTQKITRAMKMVAAAKLRRAQEAIVHARPYALRMSELVSSLALRAELDGHPLLRRGNGEGRVGLVVVTSDRGLCGAFNSTIVNAALETTRNEFEGREVEMTVVGRKGIELLRRKPCTIGATFTEVLDGSVNKAARTIIEGVAETFVRGETDEVYVLFNEFRSAISQRVTLEKILPFTPAEKGEKPAIDYYYEPSAQAVLATVLPKHLQIQMHRVLFESAASEHGARMTAMDSATNNAGDVIDHLTLKYNRARQDAITKELIEVVSGAEAL